MGGGLGLIELAVLDACASLGAGSSDTHVRTTRVLAAMDEAIGITPGVAYGVVCTLASSWKLNALLVDFHGNMGGPDWEPADATYTECRLTALGEAVLASARGELGPLPVTLVNGDMYDGGRRPPFDPRRVAAAIRLAAAGAADHDIVAAVGPPRFPTGCTVEVDLDELAAAQPVRLDVTCPMEWSGDTLTITGALPDSSPAELVARISERGAGIWDINDLSTTNLPHAVRVEVRYRPEVDRIAAEARLHRLWHIRRHVTVQLDRPLSEQIRDAVGSLVDLEHRLSLLEAAG